jgi:hypothetical protein
MKLTSGLKMAKELKKYGEKALQIAVLEAWKTYSDNFNEKVKSFDGYLHAMKKTSKTDIFLCGLLFYEFYTEGNTDLDYCMAVETQKTYYKMLGIEDMKKFKNEIEEMAGWK